MLSTFTVTNAQNQGQNSLRWAIIEANSNPGPDTIEFAPEVFRVNQQIRLDSALPTLTDTSLTTIQGPGSNRLTINGMEEFRVFLVGQGAQATISGLTIFHGHSPDSNGGAILSDGTLRLDHCIVTNCWADQNAGGILNSGGLLVLSDCGIIGNRADRSDGGGVYNEGGTLIASDCGFTDNHASLVGAAIINRLGGVATITDCSITGNSGLASGAVRNASGSSLTMIGTTLEHNTCTDSSIPSRGAALSTYGSTTLIGCTIAHNTADNSGGGIYQLEGTTTVTNCTIAMNVGTDGAGIDNAGGTLNVTNSTIARNTGRTKWYQSAAKGGGLSINGTALIVNTIIAGNTADKSENDDVYGTINGSHNLIGDSAEKLLGTLQYNGGPTPTMSLLPGSKAIGAGLTNSQDSSVPTTDQRGFPRKGVTDIGAFQSSGNLTSS